MDILDLVFPPRCCGCGRVGRYICKNCQKTIRLLPQRCPECDRQAIDGISHPRCVRSYGLDGLITVFQNTGVIKNAIKKLKYRFVYDLAESLINLIPLDKYNLNQFKEYVCYPIPLHEERLRWRGFNQSEKLGKFVAQKLNIQTVDGLLIRQAKRTPQADISKREDRIKNAQGLFSLNPNYPINPNHPKYPNNILLFDDIWTTGATMKEAAKVLKRNGVKKVWGMAVAR